jgi:hypothetical protein
MFNPGADADGKPEDTIKPAGGSVEVDNCSLSDVRLSGSAIGPSRDPSEDANTFGASCGFATGNGYCRLCHGSATGETSGLGRAAVWYRRLCEVPPTGTANGLTGDDAGIDAAACCTTAACRRLCPDPAMGVTSGCAPTGGPLCGWPTTRFDREALGGMTAWARLGVKGAAPKIKVIMTNCELTRRSPHETLSRRPSRASSVHAADPSSASSPLASY